MNLNNKGELVIENDADIEKLKLTDVMNPKNNKTDAAPEKDLETKIKGLQKGTKYTLTVPAEHLLRLIRESEVQGVTWQEFLTEEIYDKVFAAPIGKPLISKPSFAKTLITGPSKGWQG